MTKSKKSSPKPDTGGGSILKTGLSSKDSNTWSVVLGALVCVFGFIVSSIYPSFFSFSSSRSHSEVKRNKSGNRMPVMARARWHEQPETINSRRCDLSVIHMDKLTKAQLEDLIISKDPVLIKGGMLNWPSKNSPSWNLPSFLALYGNRTVNMASSHEIAYKFHSNSHEKVKLAEFLLSSPDTYTSGLYVYDEAFLKTLPELGRDFRVPKIFRDWDNIDNERVGTVKHVLSIGHHHTGLPLHSHGNSWMGLIEGVKTWYIYNPTTGDGISRYGPNAGWDFMREAYSWALQLKSEKVGVPLVCTQYPDDIVYIPSGYTHATVNEGLTVAIGGQYYESVEERLKTSEIMLNENPTNFDLQLKLALALDETAHLEALLMRKNHKVTKMGVIKLSSDVGLFLENLSKSEDTWLIQFISKLCVNCEGISNVWQQTAQHLHGIASVGVVEVSIRKDGSLDDSWAKFGITEIPSIVLFKGCQRLPRTHNFFLEEDNLNTLEGVLLSFDVDSDHLLEDFIKVASENVIIKGSLYEIPSKSRRMRLKALEYLYEAIDVAPMHPKVLTLLVRILGPGLNNNTECLKLLEEFENNFLYSSLGNKRVTAAVYHSFGVVYLSINNLEQAIRVFSKALDTDMYFTATYADLAISYYKNHDSLRAEQVLMNLEKLEPMHPALIHVRNMIWQS